MGSLVRFGVKIIITVHKLLPDTEIKGSEKKVTFIAQFYLQFNLKVRQKSSL